MVWEYRWLITWIAIMTVLTGIGVAVGLARYDECRRVHPQWYCVTEMSR